MKAAITFDLFSAGCDGDGPGSEADFAAVNICSLTPTSDWVISESHSHSDNCTSRDQINPPNACLHRDNY